MLPSAPVRGPMRRRGRRFSTRPATGAMLLIAAVAAMAAWKSGPGAGPPLPLHHQPLSPRSLGSLKEADCRQVHQAADQCAFVRAHCADDEPGLLHYLTFYYCHLGTVRPIAFAVITLWLGLLFTAIGLTASDFFSPNLNTIATVLGMSQSLAGVTFLAFGNGSPDVFSTFAAMRSNSGSMAVGELIGAAGFITAVVAGSMALVREFKVSRRSFVRDILFFIVAICFTMGVLADGELHLWECFAMIGFYGFYVLVVVGWHWVTTSRRNRLMRDVAARASVYAAPGAAADELEPYRDEPHDDDETETDPAMRRRAAADISALERGPRIEVDGVPALGDDEDDEERRNLVASEMASSMRVNRPRWSRSNTITAAPIRPSLVGALEFRSVLSSLQKERNMPMAPLHSRSHSAQSSGGFGARPRTSTMLSDVVVVVPDEPPRPPPSRSETTADLAADGASSVPHTPAISRPRIMDGMLAPPPPPSALASPAEPASAQDSQPPRPADQQAPLQLQTALLDARASGLSSPSLSCPGFSESPAALTPLPDQQLPSFCLPGSSGPRRPSFLALDEPESQPRPVRWWPYGVLPPPHVLLSTFFPTLQDWGNKTPWDKAASLLSFPCVFLLVATLPVVETERACDDDAPGDGGVPNTPETVHLGNVAAPPAVTVEDGVGAEPETEWQAYRRRARSISSRTSMSRTASWHSLRQPSHAADALPSPALPLPKPPEPAALSAELAGWNRWLVSVQLFTGPLFAAVILWANLSPDSPRALLRLVLWSLLVSLCLLAALRLTTTPDRKPRYHFLLSFLGFVIGVAWISTIAGEVVGVLKALGVILGISEAILGLTVFAVGNSLGDLVADVTIARLGLPVMALAACFGGPMLNILLGIGVGGAIMMVGAADKHHVKHPDQPRRYKPYRIHIGRSLLISAVTVLLTLLTLLVVVPANKWVMSRKIGWALIGIWGVGTLVNLMVELKGGGLDVSFLGGGGGGRAL
ncbi:hypothetical protein VTJ83DRAFT_565 [Remersonia thermophila]|uniref:Sodium/calcium exchanger membrane region domain-containing protein n=1 Tax=Remersonia thermophila TaxID=72144 RepID=A0ABR4DLD1_9PEZI